MKLLITTTRRKSRGVYQTWLLQYTQKVWQGMRLWIYHEMWCVLKQSITIPKKYNRGWDCWFITRCGVFWSWLLQYRKSRTRNLTVDLLWDVVCTEAGYSQKVWQGMRLFDLLLDMVYFEAGYYNTEKSMMGNETVDLLLDVGHVFSSRALQERKAMADDETFSGQEPCSIMWNQTAVY